MYSSGVEGGGTGVVSGLRLDGRVGGMLGLKLGLGSVVCSSSGLKQQLGEGNS